VFLEIKHRRIILEHQPEAARHFLIGFRLAAKAAAIKKKSFEKRKPPEKGFVHWDEQTYEKLQTAPPEPLVSSFSVHHHTLLNVLSRTNEDGCAALKKIIDDSHEPPSKKKLLKKHAFKLFRGLIGAKILHIIPPAKRSGPQKVAVDVSLPEDFSINHALSLYLLDAIPQLDKEAEDYALNVISLIESILENPDIVLRKQVDLLKGELMARLKDEGMEYDDRIEMLNQVEHPKPGADFIYQTYNSFKLTHPYLGSEHVKPKTIAREMIENYQSFEDYIKTYKLERAEAVLLRHLSEVYKVLAQTVPDSAKTEILQEAESFLELIVRHTDSSLLDEWQAMKEGSAGVSPASSSVDLKSKIHDLQSTIPYSKNKTAFTRHLRNHVLTLVTALSRYQTETALGLIEPADSDGKPWSNERLLVLLNTYHDARYQIRLDPEARNARHTHLSEDKLTLHQTLIDPDDLNDWSLHLTLDLEKSNARRTPVLPLESLAPI